MQKLHKKIRLLRPFFVLALAFFLHAFPISASAKPIVPQNARIAVVGDSITEARGYSRFVELYLAACQPHLKAEVFQFGWSGERVSGFLKRMDSHFAVFAPNIVTLCYGMNDGEYRPYEPTIGQNYERPLRQVVEKLKSQGTNVVLGGPGAVDTDRFPHGGDKKATAEQYNHNLQTLSGLARQIASDHGFPHADVHGAMREAMGKAKAVLGKTYHVGGADGFHPDVNGHLVMAYAFLKAMGFDGDLGTIQLNFAGDSSASGGHVLKSFEGGVATIESTRYPFCFEGPTDSPSALSSILPYVPFNEDLNRLTLVVKNADAEKLKVTWGAESRLYPREQLEKGINLAAEFRDNPFSSHFQAMNKAVAAKQTGERDFIKDTLRIFAAIQQAFPSDVEVRDATALLKKKFIERRNEDVAKIHETRRPVIHQLKVENEVSFGSLK